MASPQPAQAPGQRANYLPSVRAVSEKKMGILHSMTPTSHSWHGEVKKRFSDFQVNERRKDGEVLHLTDYVAGDQPAGSNIHIPGHGNKGNPALDTPTLAPAREITDEDKTFLQGILGDVNTSAIITLYDQTVASGHERLDSKENFVKFPPMEREVRGKVHGEIRRIFESRIETQTDKDGVIVAVPALPKHLQGKKSRGGGKRRSNQPSFEQLGGDYLHFTLYKENKDTMDAVNQIGRLIRIKGQAFGFAGTKDRRAATVQRMSLHHVRHQVLDYLNNHIPSFKMGDYKYSKYPIQLGDHGGNHFNITVKNVNITSGEDWSLERRVQSIKQSVELAVTEMSKNGFINYYGLQRFGTHAVGTHELGMLVLNENYQEAIDGLLHFDNDLLARVDSGVIEETPLNRDEINRARAIVKFKTTKDASAALSLMPRRCQAETAVIEHLKKNPRDHAGAIMRIARSMRLLYLHAYQSYVWNHVASHRWTRYGSKVIPGDLVLVTAENTAPGDIEDDSQFQRARAISEEEAASGQYTIFDVVLPGPGYDVEYPKNDIGEFYAEFMKRPENGRLDPHRMRRPIKDFSLSGNYRTLLGRFKGEPKWQTRTYLDDNEQMVPTDLDLIMIRKAKEEEKKKANAQATATVAGSVRRHEDDVPEPTGHDGKRSAEDSLQPSSKRTKLGEETADAVTSNETSTQLAEPIPEPTAPDGSAGFANTKDVLTNAPSTEQSDDPATARFGTGTIPSFEQADLSKHSEEEIKIAVVLEFGLSTSAYATVVLRELMAETEAEQPRTSVRPE